MDWVRALVLAAATVIAIIVIAAVALAASVGARLALFSHRWPDAPYPALVRLNALAGHLVTGDLMLFAAAAPSITNLVFSLEYFSHAAVVVDMGACVHDFAAGDPGCGAGRGCDPLARFALAESYPGGSRLVPLRARLTQYPGAVYLSRRAVPLAPAAEAALLRAATVAAPYPTNGELAAGVFGIGSASSAKAVAAGIGSAARAAARRASHLFGAGRPAHPPAHPPAPPVHCMYFVTALLAAADVAPPELVSSNYISAATVIAELPSKNGDYLPFVRVLP